MLDYLSSISSDGEAFAEVIESSALDVAVTSCPGWTLRDLAYHLGYVQRWARLAAAHAAEPEDDQIEGPPSDAALASWLRDGRMALIETLGSVPGDAPTWHPFPVPLVISVWPRRQAHEQAIHLWDAQSVTGTPTRLDPMLAADFVREYFEVIAPRVMARDGRQAPAGIMNVELTDVGGRLSVRSTSKTVAVMPSTEVAPTIAGSAQDVLLALWRRQPLDGAPTAGLASEWLAFGGN